MYSISTVYVCMCFPALSNKHFSNHLSVVFETINSYVVASFICEHQDVIFLLSSQTAILHSVSF